MKSKLITLKPGKLVISTFLLEGRFPIRMMEEKSLETFEVLKTKLLYSTKLQQICNKNQI